MKTLLYTLGIFFVFTHVLNAQDCYLVKDLRTGISSSNFGYINDLIEADGQLYFFSTECHQSLEMYAIDMEEDSIYLPKNASQDFKSSYCPPVSPFSPQQIVFNDQLYYSFPHADYGQELWKTDGTFEGTQLVKDVHPGWNSFINGPQELTIFNNELWFSMYEPSHGREIWHTDGTAEGTALLLDIGEFDVQYITYYNLEVSNGFLYFTAQISENHHQLWRTDGSSTGTELVLDLNDLNTPNGAPSVLQNVGEDLFFILRNDSLYQRDIYRLNTATLEAIHIHTFTPRYYSKKPFVKVGNNVYFRAKTDEFGEELWKTDGTFEGTELVIDLRIGEDSSQPTQLINFRDSLFFVAYLPEEGSRLYKTDGTAEGTTLIETIDNTPYERVLYLQIWDDRLWFASNGGRAVWYSDGAYVTPLTTNVDFQGIQGLIHFEEALYITATQNGHRGIWKWSEGNEMEQIKGNRLEQFSSDMTKSAVMQDRLFFWADSTDGDRQMWSSNGERSETYPITHIESNSWKDKPPLAIADSLLIFMNFTSETFLEPWKTNGTVDNESMIIDLNPGADGSISQFGWTDGQYTYFTGGGSWTASLYRTDGTEEGTILLRENFKSITHILTFNGATYIKGYYEGQTWLLKTDGTQEGTGFIARLNSQQSSTSTPNIVEFNGWLYFLKTGISSNRGLWRTDGTIEGSELIIQLNEDTNGSPHTLTAAGDHLFFNANDGIHGGEWWVSDGTQEGSHMLIDLNTETEGSFFYNYSPFEFKDNLFFLRKDSIYGKEIWVSDGTETGTHVFVDLIEGLVSSDPKIGVITDSLFYFTAFTETYGRELWQSDGTPEGTFMVQDICPGACSSSPSKFSKFTSDRFSFTAYSPEYGFEFWMYNPLHVPTAAHEENSHDIKVLLYPNPIDSHFTLKANDIKQVTIFDLQGKQVLTKNYPLYKNKVELDLSYIPSGIYIIKLATEKGSWAGKVIKI